MCIPFARSFEHATMSRATSDAVIVRVTDGFIDPASVATDATFIDLSDKFEWLSSTPALIALGVAVIGNKIYAAGGVDRSRRNTGANEVYDPLKDRWTKRASMPTPRDHLAVGVVGGKLYVIGGRIDGSYRKNLAVTEEYDPASNRWRSRASMPTARSGIAAAALGGRIFVFGGESVSGTFNQTESYDPATGRWETLTPMPTPRHGLGAAVLGGNIYVISGGPRPGGSFSSLNEVFTP
ncbi:MAG: galactose oxidase [Deltaproteobacteria bacterium]|nr:galactose oxidase [Deltaproteobacteria bacterium]